MFIPFAVLDTAAGVWCDTKSVVTSPRIDRYSADAAGGDAAVELTRRCRHASAAVGDLIFIYGGLRGGETLYCEVLKFFHYFYGVHTRDYWFIIFLGLLGTMDHVKHCG